MRGSLAYKVHTVALYDLVDNPKLSTSYAGTKSVCLEAPDLIGFAPLIMPE